MINLPDILVLAETDIGDIVSLVIFLAVAGISILAKMAEKWMQTYAADKEQKDRQRREARGGPEPVRRQPASQPPAPPLPSRRDEEEVEIELADMPPINVQHMPKADRTRQLRQQMLAAKLEAYRIQQEAARLRTAGPLAARPQQPPRPQQQLIPTIRPPQPAAAAAAVGANIEQEMDRLQQRRDSLEQLSSKRLSMLSPAEADTAAISARLVSIRPGQADLREHVARSLVELNDPATARAAIMFHEIFSLPKAMRHEAEMWDE